MELMGLVVSSRIIALSGMMAQQEGYADATRGSGHRGGLAAWLSEEGTFLKSPTYENVLLEIYALWINHLSILDLGCDAIGVNTSYIRIFSASS